jgi:hypothetical protein
MDVPTLLDLAGIGKLFTAIRGPNYVEVPEA